MHLRIFRRHIIVLNTAEAAADLLDKRSGMYSDRPAFVMMDELMGWAWSLGHQRYGDGWRARRKFVQLYFNQQGVARFSDVLHKTNVEFLSLVLESPEKVFQHVRRSAACNTMKLTYGIDVALENDPFAELADTAIATMSTAALPGSYLVDWVPILKHIPSWFPGAQFKRDAKAWRKLSMDMREVPFAKVKADMAAGTAIPSMTADALEAGGVIDEDAVKDAAATAYLGGADTTVAAMGSFILAMVLYPEVQRKAQEEIDCVVGVDRLPELSDRANLPYVEAIVMEVHRKYPVTPNALPHVTTKDDEYNGMFIPKGSTIIGNVWGIMHDEQTYPAAQEFKPERFIKDGKIDESTPDPRLVAFGFGRRICPGRAFADTSMWMAVATMLAVFNIAKVMENGQEITPIGEMRWGLITGPAPFKCSIKPRSEKARRNVTQYA